LEENLPGACTSASERKTTLLSTWWRFISKPLSFRACLARVFLIKISSSKDFKPISDFLIRLIVWVLPRKTELQASRKIKENFFKGN